MREKTNTWRKLLDGIDRPREPARAALAPKWDRPIWYGKTYQHCLENGLIPALQTHLRHLRTITPTMPYTLFKEDAETLGFPSDFIEKTLEAEQNQSTERTE